MTTDQPRQVYRSSANLRAELDRLTARRTVLGQPITDTDALRAAALDLRINALNHKITDTLAREGGQP